MKLNWKVIEFEIFYHISIFPANTYGHSNVWRLGWTLSFWVSLFMIFLFICTRIGALVFVCDENCPGWKVYSQVTSQKVKGKKYFSFAEVSIRMQTVTLSSTEKMILIKVCKIQFKWNFHSKRETFFTTLICKWLKVLRL